MKRIAGEIFRGVTILRNWCYDKKYLQSYKSSLPVVCVGNVVVGGSGKTPFVAFLIKSLKEQGRAPVVLSRGYGGNEIGPLLVEKHHDANDVGDEPLMLSALYGCKVVISRDRVSGAKYIEERSLGSIIVLDDGYQHRRLERDINILSFGIRDDEVMNSVRDDLLLPAGLLRESLSQALNRVDFIIANHRGPKVSDERVAHFKELLGGEREYIEVWTGGGDVLHGVTKELLAGPTEVVAFSSIARPDGYHALLESLGYKIIHAENFPDHQQFPPHRIQELRSRYEDAPFICTEKDFVRLSKELRESFYVLQPRYETRGADHVIEKCVNL